jgi:phytanoyl-CoA hydroxylase
MRPTLARPPALSCRKSSDTVGIVTYPAATDADIAFFASHGYLVVRDAIPAAHLDELEAKLNVVLDRPQRLAFDWAWSDAEARDERSFRIVQSSPSLVWPGIARARFRAWAVEFASALLRKPVAFWYDQFLAKPPGGHSAATEWHQDEAYWGRNLDEKGVTCWIPLQDVDARNGCMHFIDGGHRDGVLVHRGVPGVQSDLLFCEPDESRTVVCPIARGDVTFHHGKTPHMTPANASDAWRKAVSQHMQTPDAGGEGDHYPWKVYVNQITGERTIPPHR